MQGSLKTQAQSKVRAKGLWSYCIRPLTAAPLKMKGIAPRTAAYSLKFKDIEAVVSDAPIAQFAGNNLKWLEKNLRLHHDTIVKAGIAGAVIPMKFGMLFKTKRDLETMLKKYYKKFKSLLAELKDRQELGIKIYLDREKIIEQLKSEDKELKQFEKRKKKSAKGMEWYIEKKTEAAINEKLDGEIERCLAEIIKVLKQLAEKVAINDLPASYDEETSRGKDIILNGACLIKSKDSKLFKEHLEKSLAKFYRNGFATEITGPWPPYNFVKICKTI